MPCNYAQTIQSARVTLGKLAEILTDEQIITILTAFARDRRQKVQGYGLGVGGGYGITIDGVALEVQKGVVTGRSSYATRAEIDRLAAALGAALNEAGRQALAGQIALALSPFGAMESTDLEVEDAGVTRRATALRLTVGG